MLDSRQTAVTSTLANCYTSIKNQPLTLTLADVKQLMAVWPAIKILRRVKVTVNVELAMDIKEQPLNKEQ